MTERSPFSSQCTATSKHTGQRCRRRVVGGGVCLKHGGGAPQVAAAREARVIVYAAQHAAAEAGEELEKPRDAAAALTSALSDSDLVVQKIKQMIEGGETFDASQIDALGDWLDRVGRLSKLVMDARLDERQARRDETFGRMIVEAIKGVLAELNLTPEQQLLVPLVVPRQLRIIQGQSTRK